ncbi:aminopeptidase P family protein [Lentzea sp. PSKA42]|uniref:Aminopeptidase P family protein n=1 Tax=Lentzea indica TaxID=2604800 RepID=A0ABX1FTM1_9PSEU|nr:aminopeptidase P family protein [Lentzea indica]
MRDNDNLAFSLDEYRERLDTVRKAMAERGVDIALVSVPENIYYLTGYTTLGYYMYQVLMVPVDDEPLLLTYREERINVERLSWLDRHVDYTVTDDPVQVTVDTVRGLGVSGKTLSIEESGYFFPIRTYRKLMESLGDVRWVDGTGLVESARLVKSDAELGFIRQAADAAMAGMVSALAEARPGKTENDVAAAGVLRDAAARQRVPRQPAVRHQRRAVRPAARHVGGTRTARRRHRVPRVLRLCQAVQRSEHAHRVHRHAAAAGHRARRRRDRRAGDRDRDDPSRCDVRRGGRGRAQGDPRARVRRPHARDRLLDRCVLPARLEREPHHEPASRRRDGVAPQHGVPPGAVADRAGAERARRVQRDRRRHGDGLRGADRQAGAA